MPPRSQVPSGASSHGAAEQLWLHKWPRDAGKAKEPGLFTRWGGAPATRLLRHRSSANRVLLRRRHHKLRGLLPDVHIPTVEEEVADPARADETYEACVQFLRDSTRPREQFPMVFQANCEYGFRRNFWGMKPLGVALAVGSAVAIAARLYLDLRSNVVLEPTPHCRHVRSWRACG